MFNPQPIMFTVGFAFLGRKFDTAIRAVPAISAIYALKIPRGTATQSFTSRGFFTDFTLFRLLLRLMIVKCRCRLNS